MIGAGALGVGFLVLFAAAGRLVRVWEADPGAAEDGEVERGLFARLTELTGPDVILASSSSALVPGGYAADPARTLGAHPGTRPTCSR